MTREECIALLERYADYDGMGIPNLAGCREAMRIAAGLLKQPSLPSDLDKAAEVTLQDYEPSWYVDEVGEGQQMQAAYNSKQMLLMFKAGAEWRDAQTPKLPDDVDEAARQYAHDYTESDTGNGGDDWEDDIQITFKEGAEWMAGQGVTKETTIGMATEEVVINISQETLDALALGVGDKVIVQIRKK